MIDRRAKAVILTELRVRSVILLPLIESLTLRFFLACLISLMTLPAWAEFSYEFQMPPFFLRELADQEARLIITVDNGYPTDSKQAYTNRDILAVGMVLNGQRQDFLPVGFLGEAVYLRTDTHGKPTLDLSASSDSYVQLASATGSLQLATRQDFGPTPFVYRSGAKLGVVLEDDLIIAGMTEGYVEPAPMPAAGSFLIVAIALVFLGMMLLGKDPRDMPSARSFQK